MKFDEKKLIRSGSFGTVYRVRSGEEYFALKEMTDKQARDREAEFLKLADHPLFPKYVDSYDDEKYCILEEYIWGDPFDGCIARRGGFSQPECMRFAVTIADGIAYLQQSDGNILFRDLKAENLIIQPDGDIRLCDLGAACFLDEADLSMAGTKGDTAPEQLSSGGHQGFYSDVYAFGKLMYHMLTGKKANKDFCLSIRDTDSSFSASLELIIRQCTAEDPSERIPDMYTVLERLVTIATCTPSGYKKAEKEAERILGETGGKTGVRYSRNVQS